MSTNYTKWTGLFGNGFEPLTQGFSVLCSTAELSKLVIMINIFLIMILAMLVIFVRNPIYSVISLVLVCVNVVNVLLGLKVEYFGVILLLVYVGAIAVLFLFVVMLVNIRMVEKTKSKLSYIPIGVGIGLVMFVELVLVSSGGSREEGNYIEWASYVVSASNIESMGMTLYMIYGDGVIICVILLLVGIVGSLVITGKSDKKNRICSRFME